MAPVGAVLFDFGSTLFAHDDLPTTLAHAAARLGFTPTTEEVQRSAAAIHAAAMDPAEIHRFPRDLDAGVWDERWRALYGLADQLGLGVGRAVYEAMHDPWAWQPYASTVEVLAALRRAGRHVGVISNTGWDVRGPFTVRGMERSVDSFTLSCEVGVAKPDAAIFELACRALGHPPSDVLMVGDDPVADAGAVRCGLRTLLLPAAAPGDDNGLGDVLALAGVRAGRSSARTRTHGVH